MGSRHVAVPAPLSGARFLATGGGDVLAEGAALLELLGATVVRVPEVHGPRHGARAAAAPADGALDATGLLDTPGFPVVTVPAARTPRAAWVASGAAALTGDAGGPPWSAPGRLAERVLAAGAVVSLLAACRGAVVDVDSLALLGERAAVAGFERRGRTSVGGACEILPAADGWVALNVPRPEDVAALPALVDGEADPGDWPATARAIAQRPVDALVERATLLGLPLGGWPGPDGPPPGECRAPFRIDGRAPATGLRGLRGGGGAGGLDPAGDRPLVVDLTSLWAGPLATSLLAAAGARVVKVEGVRRPDGARRGPVEFFDLLNAGKECLALDFAEPEDRDLLRSLVAAADVVVEGSRPRVMASLGIDPGEVVRGGRATWIAITGYGREGDHSQRVAFGDDAAFAAGCTVGDPPRFVADAVADPVTGLFAAAVGLAALGGHRGHVVDVPLRGAAAYARGAGGPRGEPEPGAIAAPRARVPSQHARPLGAENPTLRAEFGYRRRS